MNTILSPNSIEYFTVNGKVYFLKNMEVHPFDELSIADATALRIDMECNQAATKAIEKHITDPIEQLRQYAACRYGALNRTPDMVNGKHHDNEQPETSCRPSCRFGCKICANSPAAIYGTPTRKEIEAAKLIPGHSDKQIADIMHISRNTVVSHLQHLREKTGTHDRSSLMLWAFSINVF